MKNTFKNTAFILGLLAIVFSLGLVSCNRSDDEADDLPQEELSDVLLKVTDDGTGASVVYDYQVNSTSNPNVKLTDGHTYSVEVIFKNGDEDATQEIRDAKDEHFLVYNFPNSDITLTRTDDASSTRADGKHVGLKTKWVVNKAIKNASAQSQLILTLFHEPVTVSEASSVSGNGVVYGSHTGGETDAQATYNIIN
ncbi:MULTISPECIES: hypothetical protein [Chryseobacterium]|uniref:Uncharacterized protein n=1 Tax=Chryseobacterium camelliae TaxID=1265445 RepID=A0ABU0TK01_9FLAO|nr:MULTISPECIES: hypothetical protein [Chryseobacterium]MDT3408778.1 hypothetical protein [Pseudacidovorax intermedius]MDQ1097367.1 hypothetical protein [Chryseobacterium camelliae]MDQ1101298.1 hypothetical protein [Chryseobacterium sp. SORGH_AS_1048]MDR6084743.1 hypothetical protein [Chryseobacterium sp. SORGH_AS_0909]MDR6133016.1 hypothetical protein [Chryseobacterium sp. SORGH_AS_1175]